MSTFEDPLHFFVFDLKNGKKKLGYGTTAQDALGVLGMRLTPEEMDEIVPESALKVSQRKMRDYRFDLG